MSITQHSGTPFDLKLGEGKAAEGRLEAILLAKGSTVEVKSDEKYAYSGNVAVEFAQNDGRGGKKPSGIAATEAKWWAIEYLADRWLIVPTNVLLQLARLEYKRQRSGVRMGDNGNVGVLVPLGALIDPWMLTPHELHVADEDGEAKAAA